MLNDLTEITFLPYEDTDLTTSTSIFLQIL